MKQTKKARALPVLLLCFSLLAAALVGCGSEAVSSAAAAESETTESTEETAAAAEGGKTTVSVALWANQLLETYAPWLQEQFPDVEFDFYIVNNSTGYYNFRAEHDTLPDIMTVRRFSLIDVEPFRDKLLDLVDTDFVYDYYQSYLRSYTYSDGAINWLPASAEVDGLIVNKTLFEQYGIPLPMDYDSLIYACQEFEKLGIQGFAADFAEDYSCLGVLQGLSALQLSSTEGRQWRQEYESGTAAGLDEEVWMPVFQRMQDFIENAGLDETCLEQSATEIREAFGRGEIAMYRGVGSDIVNYGGDYEDMLLPYPGDTEEESWLMTCPSFQVAASAAAAESEERRALILEIMSAMLSEEGLKHISSGKDTMAYAKDADLELVPELSNLSDYVKENRIYIRLASSGVFSASKDVVQRMLTGELDAQAAYDEFDSLLKTEDTQESEAVVHLDTGYSRAFVSGKGNEAASAVYNSLREDLGVDLVIGQSAIVAGDILAGDYTEAELAYIITWASGPLVKLELTGAQVKELVQFTLDVKGSRDSVTNNSTLPAASGFAMTLSQTDSGYQVEALTADGAEMDPNAVYSVVLCVTYAPNLSLLQEAGFTDYEVLDSTMKNLLKTRLLEGRQLCAPTDYITLT